MAGEVPGFERIDAVVEVGRGGNAVVYRGTERAFDRTVAVKVLSHRIQDDAERQRFERECKAVGSMSGHPNVVVVYSAGETPDGHPYIVMEYLPRSLADRLVGEGQLEWQEACDIGRTVGGALAAAHDRGVLHRDIKPENILLTAAGVPKLTDFGLARMAGGYESETNNVRASLTHAPPELLEGEAVTEATDVYSLASTIHHLISGRAPFVRPGDVSIITVVNRVLREPPPPLAPFGVPPAVEAVLVTAMSKRPQDRHASVREFLAALAAAIEHPSAAASVLAPPVERSRTRWLVATGVTAALLLGGGVAYALAHDDAGDSVASIATDATVVPDLPETSAPTATTTAASTTTLASTTTTTTTPSTTIAVTTTAAPPTAAPTTAPAPTTLAPAAPAAPPAQRTTTAPIPPGTAAPVVTAAPQSTSPPTEPPTTPAPTAAPTAAPTTAPPSTKEVPYLVGASTSEAAGALQQRGFGMYIVPGSCDASSQITGYTPTDPQPPGTQISVWCN